MHRTILTAACAAALVLAPAAVAQAPDATPPTGVIKVDTKLNSVDALLNVGMSIEFNPSEEMFVRAKATIKSRGKTVVVAKDQRENRFANDVEDYFIDHDIPHTGAKAAAALRKIKKGKSVAVTVTLDMRDLAGNKGRVSKTVKLKRRF